MTTDAAPQVTPITSLRELPDGWLNDLLRGAVEITAARKGIDPEDMAGAAFDLTGVQTTDFCQRGECPLSPDGSHSFEVMLPLLVGFYVGDNSRNVVEEIGLAPARIRFIKAHSVALLRDDNWTIHAMEMTPVGDTRSIGGILVERYLDNGTVLHFVIAFSGDDGAIDEFCSRVAAGLILMELKLQGYTPFVSPVPSVREFLVTEMWANGGRRVYHE
jgi:hypothetical protein